MRKKFWTARSACSPIVDLAFAQSLQQIVRRKVDQHDFVGLVENAVGQRLAYLDPGDAPDDVVEAFDVLDIDRRVDVDPGREKLQHILIALGVARARRIGVRKLVDEQQRRFSCERRVEVELFERMAAVVGLAPRQDLESGEKPSRVLPAVGLDDADNDVATLFAQPPRIRQHRVSLADARRRTEKYLQPTPGGASLVLADLREQGVGVGTLVAAIGHPGILATLSNARLSSSTLTPGSPRKPNWRPAVCSATSRRTSSTGRPRAFATRAT